MDSRLGPEEFRCFFDRQLEQIANALSIILDRESLWVEPFSTARFTGDIAWRQEIHFQFDNSLTGARFATAAFRIERKAAAGVTADSGFRQLRKKATYTVEYFNVGCRDRTRGFANRRLIHLENGTEMFKSGDHLPGRIFQSTFLFCSVQVRTNCGQQNRS